MTDPDLQQVQRAKWDLLLTDLEHRLEQLRQIKVFEPRRIWISAIAAAAALIGTGGIAGASSVQPNTVIRRE